MTMQIERFPVMPTRPCSFCLCLQGGSVFADFDIDDDGIVSLKRISFDGYGCCYPNGSIAKMSYSDSAKLRRAISDRVIESTELESLLRSFFQSNKDALWGDALHEHNLI